MQNFIRTIKLDDMLTDLFMSSLLSEKYQVPALSKDQEDLISYISGRFFISGFLLKSCQFSLSHKSLAEKLKYQKRILLLKQLSMKNDLNKIAHNLNCKCIEHLFLKGSALNADGIYPSGVRASRDIDVLVHVDQLHEAYDVLRSIGFKYRNKKTQDSAKYHNFGHHFPPMINENNTKLELHWRVTKSSDFKNCPLTENAFANRRISNKNPHIFCPKIETTMAHLIHHSFKTHNMNLGPIFLFDLAAIFIFFNKKWPIDNNLHKKLGIEENFAVCKKFIETVSEEESFSSESRLMRNMIFKNSQWLQLSDESKISGSLAKTTRIEILDNPNFFSKLLFKLRHTKIEYQVSYYSPKFWLFLVSDILISLKRRMC